MNQFNERTKLAMKLAQIAGKEIKAILQKQKLDTKAKGLNDVVTVGDVKSESLILAEIAKQFPHDTMIAEESGKQKVGDNEYAWAIDPLDGTMNYSRMMPYYCVSIGYLKNGKPEGGAIYIPELDELYYCEKGKGAYCNGVQIKVSTATTLQQSLTTIGFNNRYPEERGFFNLIHKNCMEQMLNVEKLFSTAISLCYVAAGKIEAHFELNCFLWDICVGALLVEEAGGKCSALNYQALDYNQIEKQVIIATNQKIHNDYEKLINRVKI